MWIISKYGIFNTDHLVRIWYAYNCTMAAGVDNTVYIISDRPVVGDIAEALAKGVRFIEVNA